MTGRALAVLVLGVLLVGGLLAAAVLLLRDQPAPARVTAAPVASLAPQARTPQDLARVACVQLRLAGQGIQAGAAAQQVREQLAAARALAAEALRGDAAHAGLSGGLAALDEAVRRDEPEAAASGLRVALASCDQLPADLGSGEP